jgi:peroxiredoxin
MQPGAGRPPVAAGRSGAAGRSRAGTALAIDETGRPAARRPTTGRPGAGGPRGGGPGGSGSGGGDERSSGAVTLVAVLVLCGLALTAWLGGPPAIADGQAAHSFSLPPLLNSSKQISLRDYDGHPLILNFCAAWSPPCTAETALLAKFYRLRPGLIVIGIDSLDSRAAGLRMLRTAQVGYPVADDPTQSVGGQYGVPGTPTTYFLNAQHQIIRTNLGWLNWARLKSGMRAMDASD